MRSLPGSEQMVGGPKMCMYLEDSTLPGCVGVRLRARPALRHTLAVPRRHDRRVIYVPDDHVERRQVFRVVRRVQRAGGRGAEPLRERGPGDSDRNRA